MSGGFPEPLRPGDPITARWLNQVIDYIFERIVVGDGLIKTKLGPGRWMIALAKKPVTRR